MLSNLAKAFKRTSHETVVMATHDSEVHAFASQLAPTHTSNPSAQAQQPQVPTQPVHIDEYYGWRQVAKTSSRFISTLLDCPEVLQSSESNEVKPDLAHFISFALDRLGMPLCIHQYAVHLIWRLKYLNPDFRPNHAHGTYLTALMPATKHSHDVDYSLKDWASVGQDMFEPSQLRENEWRMCSRLGWRFQADPMDLVKVAWMIQVEYGEPSGDGPPSAHMVWTESE
ncbi:hypothetical protein OPQ81_005852 [Rhizoctonia solani]|nr:hypothetical protein OPQ81_005852 [Rhizoctonia solani]